MVYIYIDVYNIYNNIEPKIDQSGVWKAYEMIMEYDLKINFECCYDDFKIEIYNFDRIQSYNRFIIYLNE